MTHVRLRVRILIKGKHSLVDGSNDRKFTDKINKQLGICCHNVESLFI